MSKGNAGLYVKTKGHRAIGDSLREKARKAVNRLIDTAPGSKNKAMAVGAYDLRTGRIVAVFAGSIPDKIHPLLRERAKLVGGIGTHGVSQRNTVGVCAEFHAVNQMLLNGSEWASIRLTKPVRPRTKKEMPYCDNCKVMFSDLIDE